MIGRWHRLSVVLLTVLLVPAVSVNSIGAEGEFDLCSDNLIPMIQNSGLDVDRSARAVGCRQDAHGGWWMPIAGYLVNDPAYLELDMHGRLLLDSIDRMSMDNAFTYSLRYDRLHAVIYTIGSFNRVETTDVSEAGMTDGPAWLHNYQDAYENSMMTYLTNTMGDENDLVSYIYWFTSRRDATIKVITSRVNPMVGNAMLSNWGFQRAPWPWQLADPYAIAEYTGQGIAALTVNGSSSAEANESIPKDLNAWIDVSPFRLRAAPGGSSLYFVQPIFWGDWSRSPQQRFTLKVEVPSSVRLTGAPGCVDVGSSSLDTRPCETLVESTAAGGTIVTMPIDLSMGPANRILIPVTIDSDSVPGQKLLIKAYFAGRNSSRINWGSELGPLVSRIEIVDPSEMAATKGNDTVSGRIHLTSSFTQTGQSCTRDSASELRIAAWGGDELARMALPSGSIVASSDENGGQVCAIEFRFSDLPDVPVYTLGMVGPNEKFVCRACVLGLITKSESAEVVFTVGR